MKSIYDYYSIENMYTDFLCLVDKIKLFDVLNDIILKINLDFDIKETEDSMSIIFSNDNIIKVYDKFTFEVAHDLVINIKV